MSYTFDSKGIRGTEEDRMRHTPTPWRSSETCDHRPAIQDAGGLTVASWDSATMELFGDVRPTILRAVNSHTALVEALELAKRKLQLYRAQHSGGYIGGMEYLRLMDTIDKALQQAKGGV